MLHPTNNNKIPMTEKPRLTTEEADALREKASEVSYRSMCDLAQPHLTEPLPTGEEYEELSDRGKRAVYDVVTGTLTMHSSPEALGVLLDHTFAEILYEDYCESVGGIAFNGDPLPGWDEFFADPDKERQSRAWLRTGALARAIATDR